MTPLEEKIEKFIKQNNRAARCECAHTKEDGVVYHDVTVLYGDKAQDPIYLQNKDGLVDFVKSLVEEERKRILSELPDKTDLYGLETNRRLRAEGRNKLLTQVRDIISKPNI